MENNLLTPLGKQSVNDFLLKKSFKKNNIQKINESRTKYILNTYHFDDN